MTLLSVKDLTVTFPSPRGPVPVVDGVSFDIGRERLAIVGESGSGKSMTARAILRLIRPPGRVAGALTFEGRDLATLTEREMRAVRGARIYMVMQDPRYSLNPVMSVGDQIAEALRTHDRLPRKTVKTRMREMLTAVRLDDPDRV
ncbi:MAG: ATP-binding cassette domain-containing protein, partial [Pseudomonadota bacterium]